MKNIKQVIIIQINVMSFEKFKLFLTNFIHAIKANKKDWGFITMPNMNYLLYFQKYESQVEKW